TDPATTDISTLSLHDALPISRLQKTLSADDRQRVGQYLESIREVERRIQKAESDADGDQLPDLDRPVGVPASYADHAKLMFDLRSEEHTSELQSLTNLVCRLL